MVKIRTKALNVVVPVTYHFTTTATIGGVMNGEVRSIHYLYAADASSVADAYSSAVDVYSSADVVSSTYSLPRQAADEECPWLGQIINSFYSDEELALKFVRLIQHMKPTQITALVNEWIGLKRISGQSCNRDLWRPLHEHGLYMPSEQNWNKQVRRP